jgi:ribosomal protein S18 acetylase RimI-like enzyme
MNELTNAQGAVCARIDVLPEDGNAWAIVVSWREGADGLPDGNVWNKAIESSLAECRKNGAAVIDSRVVVSREGLDEALAAARASMHRDSLLALGFTQGESRVEYRMDLKGAVMALEAGKVPSTLVWHCVRAENEMELARAADLFRQAGEGDPASHPDDDALGFLKVLLSDEGTAKVPECIQVGMCDGIPAAVIALMSYPSDGWSTIYYLGVLPAFRGRGFGAEAMLRALRCLKAIGGKTYLDGTDSRNAAARSLFARLGRPPFRTMEEWRLKR